MSKNTSSPTRNTLAKMSFPYLVIFICLLFSLDCTEANPLYCKSNQDCQDQNFPICDLSIHGCVGISPTDGGDEEHFVSDSDILVPDLSGSEVIYVDEDTCPKVGSGTQADPFCRIEEALKYIGGITRTVIVQAGSYSWDVLILEKDCQIQADGLVEIQTGQCPGIQIQQEATVTLEGLTISGSGGIKVNGNSVANLIKNKIHSTSCVGIDCQDASCFVARNQVLSNQGGGLKLIQSTYHIVNNIIARNGTQASFGGVWL